MSKRISDASEAADKALQVLDIAAAKLMAEITAVPSPEGGL
jgi:hypothetical protein